VPHDKLENMPDQDLPQHSLDNLYDKIKEVIEGSRNTAYRAVNFAMVQGYWHIGKLIVEQEQGGADRAKYGMNIIDQLSEKLTEAYGKGFDKRNLMYMRQFYQAFQNVNALRSQLSWTHYRLLMKVEKEPAREYYMNEAIESNWSTRQLDRQIGSMYYERMLMSGKEGRPAVKQEAESSKEEMMPSHLIKDPYVLEFLGLKPNQRFYEKSLNKLS